MYTLLVICCPSDRTVACGIVGIVVVVVISGVCNRCQMRTIKCRCLIFGMSIGLDPGKKCTKGIFDKSHCWEENEHFIKLSNVNKLAVNKLVLTYNVSMGAGSQSHVTYCRPSLDGF